MCVVFGHIDFWHLNHSVIIFTESHSWIHSQNPISILDGAKILLALILSLRQNWFAPVAVSLHVKISYVVHCLLLNGIISKLNHWATPLVFLFEQWLRNLWTCCLQRWWFGCATERCFILFLSFVVRVFCSCRTANFELVKSVIDFIYLLKNILVRL